MPKTERKTKARRPTKRAVTSVARRRTSKSVVLPESDGYEELVKASLVKDAIAQIETSTDEDYVDADEFWLGMAAERIAKARKAKGMTQKQLAAKLKVPQSQISRIERNPDRTTVRTLKRIAKALGVDVSALIG
jgi:ribosome-binding protein aMBF1 (putative translation factor)